MNLSNNLESVTFIKVATKRQEVHFRLVTDSFSQIKLLRISFLAIETRKIANKVRFSFGEKVKKQASSDMFDTCWQTEPKQLRISHFHKKLRQNANKVRFRLVAKAENQVSKRCFSCKTRKQAINADFSLVTWSVSRVLYLTVIFPDLLSPTSSSGIFVERERTHICPNLTLHRVGFTGTAIVTNRSVGSYTTFPPSPQKWQSISVALSLESPPPAVNWHSVL